MAHAIRPLIAGNWKMNGLAADIDEAVAIADAVRDQPAIARVALCPPVTLLSRMAVRLEGSAIELGAQDLSPEPAGAFTGDISAAMIVDAGGRLVIIGHSERRGLHGEDDTLTARKVEAAIADGLEPIVCVGETLDERQAGHAEAVVRGQIEGSLPAILSGRTFSVAYEPVWAIGAGLTPKPGEIAAMHAAIRATLTLRLGDAGARARIIYGGSVKPANAAQILHLPDVGGALVGGASLKASDFLPIVRAAG
jgi:triosephosphate isomerase